MLIKRIVGLLFILSLALNIRAQSKPTAQDSVKIFYKELFTALKTGYLHKKAVNWKAVEAETNINLATYNSFKNSLSEIRPLFDKIGATHCSLFHKQIKYSATGKTISKEDYSEQWAKKYATKPVFEIKVINEKYGYILLPSLTVFDLSLENINKIAQPLYNQIAKIKTENNLEGWIIDLRFNTGGYSTPMLLSLYDFLGDNDIWNTLNLNKKIENKVKLKDGKYFDNSKLVSYINPTGTKLDQAKVAVITGIFTASAGEVTALAFKGRQNTVFIGEPTYGATTANITWPLPFNITMALTTSYDSDRNDNYYEQIMPDIAVLKQDNYVDLLLDKKIQEAMKFITKKDSRSLESTRP